MAARPTGDRADLTPLRRYRDYRSARPGSHDQPVRSFITLVAAPLQLKALTHSYVAVGLIGVAESVQLACTATLLIVNSMFDRPHAPRALGLLYTAGAVGAAGWPAWARWWPSPR